MQHDYRFEDYAPDDDDNEDVDPDIIAAAPCAMCSTYNLLDDLTVCHKCKCAVCALCGDFYQDSATSSVFYCKPCGQVSGAKLEMPF